MNCTRHISTRSLTFLVMLFVLGFGCVPFSQASAQGYCSTEMSSQAESLLIDARVNWYSLLKHRRAFSSCDDGVVGEGYSDAVVQLFAQRWDELGTFAALGKKHPSFQRWVVRHIDATASDEDLKKIIVNATACTNDVTMKSLCQTIRQAAENALTESTR